MKVAVINLTGGGMSGGYRKYLCNVIPRMAKHKDAEAILCASPESIGVKNWFDPLLNVRFVGCKRFQFLFSYRDAELFQELEKFSPDVIFVPVERNFKFKSVPVVNMIQNMEPFVADSDGNPIRERFRHWVQYIDGRRTVRNANGVIAISEFVLDFLETQWQIPRKKIELAYHGIDGERNFPIQKSQNIPESWQNNFIFTAGSIRPARGLGDLLQAMNCLSVQGETSVKVVVAGEFGQNMTGYQKKLKDWAQKNNLSNRICWAGNLNEKEMEWCYQNCIVFVMTSRVEACPNIVLEAMLHGCISISADNPPLPEIFGDAAIFYPPKDGQALAEVIKSVLGWDKNQRTGMSRKAKKRAAEFSWDVCAEKTVAALSRAAGDVKLNGNVYE